MPVTLTFRTATEHDLPQLAAARWDARLEMGEVPAESRAEFITRFVRAVSDDLRAGGWTYWLAVTDTGGIVSQLAIRTVHSIPRPSRATDQWGYLTDCYTRPASRNSGTGTALLARAIVWARDQDLELLVAWPSERSRPWYARSGFRGESDPVTLALRAYDTPPRSAP